MIQKISQVISPGFYPYYNLALEKYLFDHVDDNEIILYLWQNERTVVCGRNQNLWKECNVTHLLEDGGHPVRRLSGGGAVFHDKGNLNFTFLVRKEDYDLQRQLSVIVEACRAMGVPAECSGRNDVLAGGRKFSGNAFYEHRGRSYHHGTLLVDVDMGNMSRYLCPSPAKLQAKGVESVRSRVVNLKDLKPGLTIGEMARQMEDAFAKVYGLPAERLDESGFDSGYIAALAERNSSWEWLHGQNLPCTADFEDRFAWGEVRLQLQVAEGCVRQAAVYTDAMDWQLAPELEKALSGCRMQLQEMQGRIRGAALDGQVKEDLCGLLARQDF